jgi:glucan biosynthesis protein C
MDAGGGVFGVGVKHQRWLLAAALAGPLVGLLSVVSAMLAYPGFSQSTQYLSELGGHNAARPAIFNTGILATGVIALLAGVGYRFALIAVGGRRLPSNLIAILFLLGGAGLIVSSIYVWPDPRHLFVQLGLGIQLCPILMIWCLWGLPGFGALRRFLVVTLVAMATLTVLTKHLVWPHLVNNFNVGWWERAFAIVLVGWVAVVAVALDRRLLRDGYWTRGPQRQA